MDKTCKNCSHWEGWVMDSVGRELIIDCTREGNNTCPSWRDGSYDDEWPSNERIDRIGRDGNDGLHYEEVVI